MGHLYPQDYTLTVLSLPQDCPMCNFGEFILSFYSFGYSTEYHIYQIPSIPKEIKVIKSTFKTACSREGGREGREGRKVSAPSWVSLSYFVRLGCLKGWFWVFFNQLCHHNQDLENFLRNGKSLLKVSVPITILICTKKNSASYKLCRCNKKQFLFPYFFRIWWRKQH